jgi:hypothetical protein
MEGFSRINGGRVIGCGKKSRDRLLFGSDCPLFPFPIDSFPANLLFIPGPPGPYAYLFRMEASPDRIIVLILLLEPLVATRINMLLGALVSPTRGTSAATEW